MKEKFYITTAIDYVNASPHIGHALEKVQADVLARYRRFRGDDVFYLTGTDEHGAKIARAAKAAKKEPQKFVDLVSAEFKNLKTALNLSWDDFIRTSDRGRHWPGVELMWKKLSDAGDIYKKAYKGLYCVGHEAFITEKDLVDGKCSDHGSAPELIEEENYFFRLSRYEKEIFRRIKNNELKIVPEGRKNEILSLIEGGLEDVSFSRPRKDLSWGIPVPGDDSQTVYVWCDALTNYLSAIGFGELIEEEIEWWSRKGRHGADPRDLEREVARRFFTLWPADVHVIGKDILRFHAAIWPGMLLSAGLPLPRSIFVHGFITVEGQKMSKTIGNVIDPFKIVKMYGSDAVRYYLLREITSGEDGDWSERKFIKRYNGDLANGLGNFVARVGKLAEDIGVIDGKSRADYEVSETINEVKNRVFVKMEEFQFNEALQEVWKLISFGDKYLNEKKPWEKSLSANSRSKIIFNLVVVLDNVATLLQPFLPETSEKIIKSIFWEGNILRVQKISSLFPRLS